MKNLPFKEQIFNLEQDLYGKEKRVTHWHRQYLILERIVIFLTAILIAVTIYAVIETRENTKLKKTIQNYEKAFINIGKYNNTDSSSGQIESKE